MRPPRKNRKSKPRRPYSRRITLNVLCTSLMRSRALGAILQWKKRKQDHKEIMMGLCNYLVRSTALEASLGEEKEKNEKAIQFTDLVRPGALQAIPVKMINRPYN